MPLSASVTVAPQRAPGASSCAAKSRSGGSNAVSAGCSTAHSCRSTMRWLARAWKPSSLLARVRARVSRARRRVPGGKAAQRHISRPRCRDGGAPRRASRSWPRRRRPARDAAARSRRIRRNAGTAARRARPASRCRARVAPRRASIARAHDIAGRGQRHEHARPPRAARCRRRARRSRSTRSVTVSERSCVPPRRDQEFDIALRAADRAFGHAQRRASRGCAASQAAMRSHTSR